MTNTRRAWSITVERDQDSPDLFFLTANAPSGEDQPLYASARTTWRRGKTRVQLSLWQTEDGEHVDDRDLERRGAREVVRYLKQVRNC